MPFDCDPELEPLFGEVAELEKFVRQAATPEPQIEFPISKTPRWGIQDVSQYLAKEMLGDEFGNYEDLPTAVFTPLSNLKPPCKRCSCHACMTGDCARCTRGISHAELQPPDDDDVANAELKAAVRRTRTATRKAEWDRIEKAVLGSQGR